MTIGTMGHSPDQIPPYEDQLRLMAKIARLYHQRGMRQGEIADELHVSQPRVSRLLKRAEEVGIVKTVVTMPSGVHTDLEDALESVYSLGEAVVVDVDGDGDESLITEALGVATATYLKATLTGGDTIGISSWSETLLAATQHMRPGRVPVADSVVQLVGGVGDPRVQMQATRLLDRFANATGALPLFMSAPGLLGSSSARASLMADETIAKVVDTWSHLTVAVVGIGSLEPSPLLRDSGNALAESDQAILRGAGAVGDICQRFFDASGAPVGSAVDDRVVGINYAALRRIPRRVAVAGGIRKHSAIRAALLGGWVNVLITDLDEAQRLLADAGHQGAGDHGATPPD